MTGRNGQFARAGLEEVQSELQSLEQKIACGSCLPREQQVLLHRDAAYQAMELGDLTLAMTHAMTSLDLARSVNDPVLHSKAHVTVGLVMGDTVDDAGAVAHFQEANRLARASGDRRMVALVAINASHYEKEREKYVNAAIRLSDFLASPESAALNEGGALLEAFHVNFTIAASQALIDGQVSPRREEELIRQLSVSASSLHERVAQPTLITQPLRILEIFDGLVRYEFWQERHDQACDMATDWVVQAQQTGSRALHGRALLGRAWLSSRLCRWTSAAADARLASDELLAGRLPLLSLRAQDIQAASLARLGRMEEAYTLQHSVSHATEELLLSYFQRGTHLRQIERRALEAEVRAAAFAEAALHDSLTGAPNRARAMQYLEELQARAVLGQTGVLAITDLDHFKMVNDTYGHVTGDGVLRRVVEVARGCLRDGDLFARFGGEEFIVLLPGTTLEQGMRICGRIRATLESTNWSDLAPELIITASFGLTAITGERDSQSLLHAADTALYEAKAAGRNALRVAAD